MAENPKSQVLKFVNSTMSQIFFQLRRRPYGEPRINLDRIVSMDLSIEPVSQKLIWIVRSRKVTYGWPGKTRDEAWRFACVGKLLVEIYAAIKSGRTVTKRDLYYQDPALFKRQETVDMYIDDIAYTCGVTRRDLNVTASPKGLYVGAGLFDNTVNVIVDNVFPAITHIGFIKWVLVLEKEATFKSLVEAQFHKQTIESGIMITAKGYPDLASRKFLRRLTDRLVGVPVYGLFDADPDGLDILRCYAIGSKSTAHEPEANVPGIKWLGLELANAEHNELMPLTARDRTKARIMLTRINWYEEFGCGFQYRVELQAMLMMNCKAETQGIKGGIDGLVRYLERRMTKEHYHS